MARPWLYIHSETEIGTGETERYVTGAGSGPDKDEDREGLAIMQSLADPKREKDLNGTPADKCALFWALFNTIGAKVVRTVNDLGAALIFSFHAFRGIFRRKQAREILQQTYYVGARSSGIVLLIGLFTGMVLGLQLAYTLKKFGSEGFLGSVVALSLIRELGPVLTAIMITARAGSAMSAELGILRISEQIDALYTMRIDPLGFLVSPRMAASVLGFPILTAFFDLAGILGGYLTGVVLLGVDGGAYFARIHTHVDIGDIRGGFIKSLVFAVLVSTVCCYKGYFTHRQSEGHGAKSVSISTTSAVVLSCILILVADYVITSFLM